MSYIKSYYGETIAKSNFIKPKDIKFQVNGNITTCILTVDITSESYTILRMAGIKFLKPKTLIGIAKCSPKDTFDELKGRDIAEHKAFRQYYSLLHSIFNTLQNYFEQAAGCAYDFKRWAWNKVDMQDNLANKYN